MADSKKATQKDESGGSVKLDRTVNAKKGNPVKSGMIFGHKHPRKVRSA